MENEMQFVNPCSPGQLSSYFDAFVQIPQTTYDPSTWMPTLNNLRDQKEYLEELLCKTATTLNALRDRQTRNERVISTHPTPRSKRRKILQNKWRTGKTIQTCENEERAVIDCLRVCESNIHTMEAMINPPDMAWIGAEYYTNNSYTDSDTTPFDWQFWTDEAAVSQFEQSCQRPLPLIDAAPDTVPARRTEAAARRLPVLSLRSDPAAAPSSAYTNFMLSPEAAEFEPSAAHLQQPVTRVAKELDKLTISGFLASKRMHSIRRRRSSDAADNHMSRHPPSNVGSTLTPTRSCQSSTGSSAPREVAFGGCGGNSRLERSKSI